MYIVHRPLDVLLVGGLNDILREATDSEIIEDIDHFRRHIKVVLLLQLSLSL